MGVYKNINLDIAEFTNKQISLIICSITILSMLLIMPADFIFGHEKQIIPEKFYGMLTLKKYDDLGNEIFSQTVHNRLVNQGETFLLNQAFLSNADLDSNRFSSICIIEPNDDVVFLPDNVDNNGIIREDLTSVQFDDANSIILPNCLVDLEVDLIEDGRAIIGPLNFRAGENIAVGGTIHGIGICKHNDDASFSSCARNNGDNNILFAAVSTSHVTLNEGDSAEISYTFDITSDTT